MLGFYVDNPRKKCFVENLQYVEDNCAVHPQVTHGISLGLSRGLDNGQGSQILGVRWIDLMVAGSTDEDIIIL